MPGVYDEGVHYITGYGLGIDCNVGGGTVDVGCGGSN